MLQITPWERIALQLLASGETTNDIAAKFEMSDGELEVRLSTLFSRMGVRDSYEASVDAFRRGLLPSASAAAAPAPRSHDSSRISKNFRSVGFRASAMASRK